MPIEVYREDGLASSTAMKGPCRVATTANITLSGTQTIDGVAVVANDRVLVKDQSTATENGIYVVDTGAWRRASDFAGNRDVKKGSQVYVTDGTGAGTYAVTTANPIVIDDSSIAFAQIQAASGVVVSVNAQTGAVVLDADDIDDTSTTHKFATAAEKTKLGFVTVTQNVNLDTIESLATAAAPQSTTYTEAEVDALITAAVAAINVDSDVQQFVISGTWTKPSFGSTALVEVWGGGGSGGRAGSGDGGGGGGGGSYRWMLIPLSLLGATESVTVGAGGAAITVDNTDGNAGGNSSFGSWLTAYAGGGGAGNVTSAGGGGGGAGPGGAGSTNAGGGAATTNGANGGVDLVGGAGGAGGAGVGGNSLNGGAAGGAGNSSGGNAGGNATDGGGGGGGGTDSNNPGAGGNSIRGGAGGGGGKGGGVASGAGGTSKIGGNGGAGAGSSNNATAGAQPGGGGGGSCTGNSGAGGDGRVRVTVW